MHIINVVPSVGIKNGSTVSQFNYALESSPVLNSELEIKL
jgi:hypothetical protein